MRLKTDKCFQKPRAFARITWKPPPKIRAPPLKLALNPLSSGLLCPHKFVKVAWNGGHFVALNAGFAEILDPLAPAVLAFRAVPAHTPRAEIVFYVRSERFLILRHPREQFKTNASDRGLPDDGFGSVWSPDLEKQPMGARQKATASVNSLLHEKLAFVAAPDRFLFKATAFFDEYAAVSIVLLLCVAYYSMRRFFYFKSETQNKLDQKGTLN